MKENCDYKERGRLDNRKSFNREFEEYIKDYSDLDYTYDLGFNLCKGRINNTYSKNDIENDLLGIGGDLSKWNVRGMDMSRLRRYWGVM